MDFPALSCIYVLSQINVAFYKQEFLPYRSQERRITRAFISTSFKKIEKVIFLISLASGYKNADFIMKFAEQSKTRALYFHHAYWTYQR